MDVSIAVSLIRGQMGTVVERAVNGAVETVLAEMLKVVGVKFDELKTQLALMKRDVALLQREKALKDKENDSIRAKLRYTELKLKYYRQGVEEELQQRVSASTLIHVHPSTNPPQALTGTADLSLAETSCSSQNRTNDRHSDVVSSDSSDFLFPVSLPEISPVECAASNTESNVVECVDAVVAPAPPSDGSTQADSSTLPPFKPQVKQEQTQEEEEEVICIKEEPEEEQEVLAKLAVDSSQSLSGSESHSSFEFHAAPTTSFSAAGKNSYLMVPPMTSLPSMVSLHSGLQSRPAARPWMKTPGLYEQYKLRRGDLQQKSLNRRRKLEETLPQPLLADMLRERREKTRLRVARWRAKRKLQFCLTQAQAQGGAAGRPQTNFISGKHQHLRESAPPGGQQRPAPPLPQSSSFHYVSATNTATTSLPFITSSSSSSSSLLPMNSIMSSHHNTVTSSTFPQINHSFPPDVLQ